MLSPSYLGKQGEIPSEFDPSGPFPSQSFNCFTKYLRVSLILEFLLFNNTSFITGATADIFKIISDIEDPKSH